MKYFKSIATLCRVQENTNIIDLSNVIMSKNPVMCQITTISKITITCSECYDQFLAKTPPVQDYRSAARCKDSSGATADFLSSWSPSSSVVHRCHYLPMPGSPSWHLFVSLRCMPKLWHSYIQPIN